jgi:hypothetical protein
MYSFFLLSTTTFVHNHCRLKLEVKADLLSSDFNVLDELLTKLNHTSTWIFSLSIAKFMFFMTVIYG